MKHIDDDSVEQVPSLINNETRENLLVGALEGGSNYWYLVKEKQVAQINKHKEAALKRDPEYGDCFASKMFTAILKGEKIDIYDAEDEDTKLGTISLESIRKGEAIMADKHKPILGNIMKEEDDAADADAWFQLCVMGEIIFG